MVEHDLVKEINRINGSLDALSLLREKLQLQLNEIGAESAQEAVNEMLTHVEAMQLEYLHRRNKLHVQHKSYQFYLTDKGILPILHDCYVELVSGKANSTEFANQTIRLADWYVRMLDDVPQQVVNETYSWLVFDEFGRLNFHAAQTIDTSALPTMDEREQIQDRLYQPE